MFTKALAVALLGVAVAGPAAHAASTTSKIKAVTTDFAYTPAEWTVHPGEKVRLTLVNQGATKHEWVLLKQGMEVTPPFDADDESKVFWEVEVNPGKTKTASFKAPAKPGDYNVVCGTAGHFEHGMKGILHIQ